MESSLSELTNYLMAPNRLKVPTTASGTTLYLSSHHSSNGKDDLHWRIVSKLHGLNATFFASRLLGLALNYVAETGQVRCQAPERCR